MIGGKVKFSEASIERRQGIWLWQPFLFQSAVTAQRNGFAKLQNLSVKRIESVRSNSLNQISSPSQPLWFSLSQ